MRHIPANAPLLATGNPLDKFPQSFIVVTPIRINPKLRSVELLHNCTVVV